MVDFRRFQVPSGPSSPRPGLSQQAQEMGRKIMSAIEEHATERRESGRPASDAEVLYSLLAVLRSICHLQVEAQLQDEGDRKKFEACFTGVTLQKGMMLEMIRTEDEPVQVTLESLAVCMMAEIERACRGHQAEEGAA